MGSFANVGQYNFTFIVEPEIEHAVRHPGQGRLFGISPLIEEFNCVALGFRTDHRKLAVGPSTHVDRHDLSVATYRLGFIAGLVRGCTEGSALPTITKRILEVLRVTKQTRHHPVS